MAEWLRSSTRTRHLAVPSYYGPYARCSTRISLDTDRSRSTRTMPKCLRCRALSHLPMPVESTEPTRSWRVRTPPPSTIEPRGHDCNYA